jgi:Ca-activated chloride channel family protein
MAGKPLELAKQASKTFLSQLKAGDRAMVVAISSTAEIIAPLSADRFTQTRVISALDPWSTTALRDAIVASLDRLEPEPGRQALVLFSDGNDRYSRASESEVIARARRSNALVYPITFGKQRPAFLAELAVLTGGRSFLLKDATELEKTLSTIARELRYQYLLGYAPSEPIAEGVHQWRSIRVTLTGNHPGLRVRARDGYTTD